MHLTPESALDPEDILSSSLQTLYEYTPIIHSSAGSLFTYTTPYTAEGDPIDVTLRTPDTHSSNWSLHASSIWTASIFLADHLCELDFDSLLAEEDRQHGRRRLDVLELGAGAGLPGILIAKLLSRSASRSWPTDLWKVTLSDYPDDNLIRALEENVKRNDLEGCCRVVPYAWGSDVSILLNCEPSSSSAVDVTSPGFDLIVAADTLWNHELHSPFLLTLQKTLRRASHARAHLIAGLHTGRYTLQGFLNTVGSGGLEIEGVKEVRVEGGGVREWQVDRQGVDDERDRRLWVVWIVLKWTRV